MRKLIALILALLMAFSIATVAFAEGEEPAAGTQTQDVQNESGTGNDASQTQDAENAQTANSEETTTKASEENNELLDTIMDLPAGPALAVLKVGKIVLKFVKVFAKLGVKFGLIDTESIVNSVAEMFGLDPETELPPGTAQAIKTLI